jgi:hypothetical protein
MSAEVGSDLANGAAGASVLQAMQRPENILRAASGVLLVGGIALCFFTQAGGLFVILAPVLAALFLPLLQLAGVTQAVEECEATLTSRRRRAQQADGKFARFFRQPFYACACGIWSISRPIKNNHLRAGVRVALSLYFFAISVLVLVAAAYLIVAVVVIVVVLVIIGWVLSLNDRSGGGVTVRRRTGWFGDEHLEYTDAAGRKLGESRETTGFFGDRRQEHFDAHGHKVGQSARETGFFGDEKTVHYDQDGKTVGTSREETGFLGDPKTVHYDEDGRKTGESRPSKDLFGNDVIEHFDEAGNKTGETR